MLWRARRLVGAGRRGRVNPNEDNGANGVVQAAPDVNRRRRNDDHNDNGNDGGDDGRGGDGGDDGNNGNPHRPRQDHRQVARNRRRRARANPADRAANRNDGNAGNDGNDGNAGNAGNVVGLGRRGLPHHGRLSHFAANSAAYSVLVQWADDLPTSTLGWSLLLVRLLVVLACAWVGAVVSIAAVLTSSLYSGRMVSALLFPR